jgi:hypothetical protein
MPQWKVASILVSGLALLVTVYSALQEANPLTGTWEIRRAFEDGIELTSVGGMYLDIENDHAKIACSQICGFETEVYARGAVRRNGNKIHIYKCLGVTSEHSPEPCATLVRLPNGDLSYEMPAENGKTSRVEFRRISNAPTLLDLLGWR